MFQGGWGSGKEFSRNKLHECKPRPHCLFCECGCPDITMESLILREPWRLLFTPKEKEVAIARLKIFGYKFDHGEITDITNEA